MEFKELISHEKLQERMAELAKEIEKDYEGKDITMICVMTGAIFFTVELSMKIKNKVLYDFIQLSSYGDGTESSGQVIIKSDLKFPVEGKNVLIVEDIVDTGRTMDFLKNYLLNEKKANSVKICALANKQERREVDVDIDYLGFEIPNKFVVGFGFDIEGAYRNLPYVGYVD